MVARLKITKTKFSTIIEFAQKVGAPPKMIKTLGGAKKEKHFEKAFQSVKDAVPPALLINGHNPLLLLHSALSGISPTDG